MLVTKVENHIHRVMANLWFGLRRHRISCVTDADATQTIIQQIVTIGAEWDAICDNAGLGITDPPN